MGGIIDNLNARQLQAFAEVNLTQSNDINEEEEEDLTKDSMFDRNTEMSLGRFDYLVSLNITLFHNNCIVNNSAKKRLLF